MPTTAVSPYDGSTFDPKNYFIDGEAITPSDTDELPRIASAIYIGGAGSGNLKVVTRKGTTLTFSGMTVGLLRLSVRKVFATGTDVTSLVALW